MRGKRGEGSKGGFLPVQGGLKPDSITFASALVESLPVLKIRSKMQGPTMDGDTLGRRESGSSHLEMA